MDRRFVFMTRWNSIKKQNGFPSAKMSARSITSLSSVTGELLLCSVKRRGSNMKTTHNYVSEWCGLKGQWFKTWEHWVSEMLWGKKELVFWPFSLCTFVFFPHSNPIRFKILAHWLLSSRLLYVSAKYINKINLNVLDGGWSLDSSAITHMLSCAPK